jgi:hypothetical protein
MVEHFILHGGTLSHVSILTDPVYLTEPLVKSEEFNRDEAERQGWLWPCEPVEEITSRAPGEVQHFLPGENPYLREFFTRWKIPEEAARGGAHTMYPEYQARIKALQGKP